MDDILFSDIPNDITIALTGVSDPEIPVLSIMDMGVVRDIQVDNKAVNIKITPTYSGCPAMDTMSVDIKKAIDELGYETKVDLVLSPPWTTDWITPKGKANLEAYGIAPPLGHDADKRAIIDEESVVPCPNCKSTNTKMVSEFGSTACKAFFQCNDCLEPFDYFKCLK